MGMMEEHFTVLVDGVERPVTVTYKRIRNIYLRVDADGSLKVSCPRYVGLAAVRRFIAERAHWIGRTEVKARASEAQNRNGVTGPILWWMGEKKYARYEEAARSRMNIEGDVATFYLKEQNDAAIEKAFDAAARRQLAAMIEEYRPQWDAPDLRSAQSAASGHLHAAHEEPLGRLHAGQVQDCHEHAAGPLSEGMHAVCAAA
jgi:predicted metal-dependent hydrolase